MEYTNKLSSTELGVYLGILCGIALVQATGLIFGLIVCPIVGFIVGKWMERVARASRSQRWLEEE